jgi:NodT family efflux transporter outer membrane factor (OMF) lipoprotein
MNRKYLLILILFSSCTGKDKSKIETLKDVSLKSVESFAYDSEKFKIGDYPENKWWEEFKDDKLSCLIETAFLQSPNLLAAKKRVEVANQTALMVRSDLFPQISGIFQYAFLYLADSQFLQAVLPGLQNSNFLYNLMFSFDYEFDFWGKNLKKYKASLGSAHSVSLEYEQTKLILSTAIAKSYTDLIAKKAKKQVIEQMLIKKEKFVSLSELLKKNRIDSSISINTFNQKVKNIEETLLILDKEILLSESLINILVGRNPSEPVETIPLYLAFEVKPYLPENISSTLLAHRPDLLSALWIVKKNALDLGVSVREFLPTITILEGPAFAAGRADQFLGSNTFANLLFPEIKQPLYSGGKLLANWKKSKASYQESIYTFNDLFLKAAKDVQDSIIKYMETEGVESIAKEKLDLSLKNYELEHLRFSHGISSMLSVIEYEEIYLQNKSLMIERQREKNISYIEFIKSIGGGFVEDQNESKK